MTTLFARKKALYEIEPSGIRTAGIALTLFTTVLSLAPAHEDRYFIDDIESADCEPDEAHETPPLPPHADRTPIVWGGTRLGQWVIVERSFSILKKLGYIDDNTISIVDHGRHTIELYVSDFPNGGMSSKLENVAKQVVQDVVSFRGGATQGDAKVLAMRDRPTSRGPSSTLHLVTRKLRGEHVPIPFTDNELFHILKADIKSDGVLCALNEIRPGIRGRYLLEWHKFGPGTARVQVVEGKDCDVLEECDWFERVFPELIQPGIDVVALPATKIPRAGMYQA